jgi:hypothetical protein
VQPGNTHRATGKAARLTQAPPHRVERPTYSPCSSRQAIPQERAAYCLQAAESNCYLWDAGAWGESFTAGGSPHFSGMAGKAGPVQAGHGMARSGESRHGKAGTASHGEASLNESRRGRAGVARHVLTRRGESWHGRHGRAGRVLAWQGVARRGTAWRGRHGI